MKDKKEKIIAVLVIIARMQIWLSLIAVCAFGLLIIIHKVGEAINDTPYLVSFLLVAF